MAITVGTDTYVTVTEADTYINKRPNATAWTALTTAQKEGYLLVAREKIDLQNIRGQRYTETQDLEFPRDFKLIADILGEVPTRVKESQTIEANMYANETAATTDIRNGIKSRSIKSASVTYSDKKSNNSGLKLDSTMARMKLGPYLLKTITRR